MMLRLPVRTTGKISKATFLRLNSSSASIRTTFINYFTEIQGHKHVKSSSVVPLCDPTVPFVNAGMNQFKGVFLGKCTPPCHRAVNSQKCIRVGGKHNDLDTVGLDGYHHTFFEMLGNWSFGDYYKKHACRMAWELLLGPYQLKPENLVVTYFGGDVVMNLQEDRECRDIWKNIGVQPDRLRAMDAKENFWEMGTTGPCGPCTEIHYVNPDGTLTEIWNIVFIQYNREPNGSITTLNSYHVDTGMGLERMAALLQSKSSNYDTDLFEPIIKAIQRKSNAPEYTGKFESTAGLDISYRRLADHARMIAVCLADGAFPASSLNLKQIMRKSFKISEDVFNCKTGMLSELYNPVAESLGPVYPELLSKENDVKKIIEHEEQSYGKLRLNLAKKWKDLVKQYPEVENLHDVELAGFTQGYREFKKVICDNHLSVLPGDIVFKLYDTYGFHEDLIQRIAKTNNLLVDNEGFNKLLNEHKSRHKTAFKEQNNNNMALCFDKAIDELTKIGINNTNDVYKYKNKLENNEITFAPLKTKLVAMLNSDGEWLDFLEVNDRHSYYLVTESTNFYSEEGGQAADTGTIKLENGIDFIVESVFKIRDYLFHKGRFIFETVGEKKTLKLGEKVLLEIDSKRRLDIMRNHTAIHLLNAAFRKVLSNSVLCQVGSNVNDKGLVLNLSVYGDKLTHNVVMAAQDLVRKTIEANIPVKTSVLNSIQLSQVDDVVTVPGEIYPETGLRLVQVKSEDLQSRELCCGTHLPSTKHVGNFCVSVLRQAGSNTPQVYALTGQNAAQVEKLTNRVREIQETFESLDSDTLKTEISDIKERLSYLSGTTLGGSAIGECGACVAVLEKLNKKNEKRNDVALDQIAMAEMSEVCAEASKQGRPFVVHFLRSSYMMESASVRAALRACVLSPALVLGCANGIMNAACVVPESYVTKDFTAEKWLTCILPVFESKLASVPADQPQHTYAAMIGTKVSLITCEQLVADAMRAAIKYAAAHVKVQVGKQDGDDESTQNRQQN